MLADIIFANTTPNQNIMVYTRDIQTILEHLYSYRAFLKDMDAMPNHGSWPVDANKFELFGFLYNVVQNKKEGWVNSDLTEHKILIFDLDKPLELVEIVIKGMSIF